MNDMNSFSYMSTRKEIVSSFYGQYDEDGRTVSSRHGQLEYYTIHFEKPRYFLKAMKMLEKMR